MSVSVYEVEMVSPAPGQRLVQHIKAEDSAEAEAKVAAIQNLEIVGTKVRRPCTEKEETVFLAAKAEAAAAAAAEPASEHEPVLQAEAP